MFLQCVGVHVSCAFFFFTLICLLACLFSFYKERKETLNQTYGRKQERKKNEQNMLKNIFIKKIAGHGSDPVILALVVRER